MELDEIQQKIEIALDIFPVGTRVCNTKIGTVGHVMGQPWYDKSSKKIFLYVTYLESEVFQDDIDCLIPLSI